ncbi:MAG: IPT/TIG domain-containing protein, partial [Verrucomicrobiales bacterium]|nr:IPT/TIG domain-containing protein [Verrucomicrobiales bacterium]
MLHTRTRLFGLLAMVGLAFLSTTHAATISGFSPDRGGPGTEVTLTGTGLQTTMFVYFGSTEASGEILFRSANSVRARVPPTALTGQLSVFTSGSGSASSLGIFVTTPRIESFTPLSGAPGTLVTLSGVNVGPGQFGSRGNVTGVRFNGQPAQFEIAGINQLLALVPTNATTGPITLINEAGSSSSQLSFHVAPLISSLSSTNGMPGDPIEIRGANLGTALRVEFGFERAEFSVTSPSNLVARVPTNAVN